MTPKEKSTELVEKFSNVEHCGVKHFPNQSYCDCDGGMNNYMAKQCALIAVDEIISTIEFMAESEELDKLPFWQQVKQEIENL